MKFINTHYFFLSSNDLERETKKRKYKLSVSSAGEKYKLEHSIIVNKRCCCHHWNHLAGCAGYRR